MRKTSTHFVASARGCLVDKLVGRSFWVERRSKVGRGSKDELQSRTSDENPGPECGYRTPNVSAPRLVDRGPSGGKNVMLMLE